MREILNFRNLWPFSTPNSLRKNIFIMTEVDFLRHGHTSIIIFLVPSAQSQPISS